MKCGSRIFMLKDLHALSYAGTFMYGLIFYGIIFFQH
ncbi:MAG: hypothetical protein JWO89_2310 [Verrucomicrobiaceae bacterium]|nr:hypothetical protein [Verrucomicrobiaceae bacterium]